MQLFLLVLILGIFGHDALLESGVFRSHIGWRLAVILLAVHLFLGTFHALVCRRVVKHLNTTGGIGALRWVDVSAAVYRWTVLGLYLLGLWLGVLRGVRRVLGDWVLLDEAVVLAGPLVMFMWGWWVYYPIDKLLREATLIRRLDEGVPVRPIWTRGQYLISQLRHQVALILAPLLVLMGFAELIERYTPQSWMGGSHDPRPLLMLLCAVLVFLFAPVMIRGLWDTSPLPDGELRDRLLAMCRRYRVGIRQLLLWRTFGGMINGAVMGIVAPVRYILLTDALLERLPQDRVEAVMAHELAHVKQHHMFWLMATAVGAMGGLIVVWAVGIEVAIQLNGGWLTDQESVQSLSLDTDIKTLVILVAALASWVGIFGWVSRRFERQADTFSIQHLARDDLDAPVIIDNQSVAIMTGALQQVADLNHIPSSRRSWRHGSIAWRQAYLRSLVGKRTDTLPIYTQVRVIKLVSGAAIIAQAGLQGFYPGWFNELLSWL